MQDKVIEIGDSTEKTCPRCGRGLLYDRVHRVWWVKAFLFFLPIRRYKCYTCGRKPYIWEREDSNG